MKKAILVINAGSSSIKFSVYVTEGENGCPLENVLKGQVDGIDVAPRFVARSSDGTAPESREWSDPKTGRDILMRHVLDRVRESMGGIPLKAAGHRVVHGGTEYDAPVIVDDAIMADLAALAPLAPLHQMHNLDPIRILGQLHPDLAQVACFDTVFHRTNPPEAQMYALPRVLTEEGVRRYGFHGLSYEYIARALERTAPALYQKRLIVAHLGSGASMCALNGGKSVSNSFGFSTLGGLMMGTRPGTLDAGVILYLMQRKGMSGSDIERLLYRESGLLGVSSISNDMRYLENNPDPHAMEAVRLFVYRAAVEMGALMTALGGIDGLIFTAGIGENSPRIRSMICERVREWTGIRLDEKANATNAVTISATKSRIPVMVVPTDEELMIATHTLRLTTERG